MSNNNYERYKDRYLTVYAKDGWIEGSLWEKVLDEIRKEESLTKNSDAVKVCILESAFKRKIIDKKEFDIYKETKI